MRGIDYSELVMRARNAHFMVGNSDYLECLVYRLADAVEVQAARMQELEARLAAPPDVHGYCVPRIAQLEEKRDDLIRIGQRKAREILRLRVAIANTIHAIEDGEDRESIENRLRDALDSN